MKNKLSLILGLFALLLTGCNQLSVKDKHKFNRYVVKLVYRDERVRLGADGLTDEEFDKVSEGQSLIPGDVLLIEKDDDLSIIEVLVEKQDLSDKYMVPVVKHNNPTGLDDESSKYEYEIMFERDFKEMGAGNYVILFNRKTDCIVNQDSSASYLWQLRDDTKFYALFDASCCEKRTFENDLGEQIITVFYVRPLLFVL